MFRRKAKHNQSYHWHRNRIEDWVTQPLPLGNLPFRLYLSAHRLTAFDVARLSGIRYFRIWHIEHGIPIGRKHAILVRERLQRVTGVAYTGPIVLHERERERHETL